MITVLADDLSGAAEVAGACHTHGLAAEVQITPRPTPAAALCLDADTRALPPHLAQQRSAELARALRIRPGSLFKKADSVLRGPIAAEVAGLLAALDLPRALLVPANPARGRIIRGGQYLIHDQPLAQTEFADDPEHPARTSDVVERLTSNPGLPITVVRPGDTLPPAGLIVGETTTPADLLHWAARLDNCTLPAGSAAFFDAWLARIGGAATPPAPALADVPKRTLVVSGTTSLASRAFCRECETRGVPVLRMPPELFAGQVTPVLEAQWEAATRRALNEHPLAVVAIDQPLHPSPDWPARLRASLAGLVASVLAHGGVGRLFIEGGATARAIVERLGWVRLAVRAELAPGIVALQPLGAAAPLVILKPGSYPWPDLVKESLYGQVAPAN